MCDVFNLDYPSQYAKLAKSAWATVGLITTVAEDGKNRELFCLHVKSVPMWLATIDANRVALEARPKILRFQREAADILYRWAMCGCKIPEIPETREQFLARAFQVSMEVSKEKDIIIAGQRQEIAAMIPYVAAWQQLSDQNGLFNMQNASRACGLPPNALNQLVVDWGYCFRDHRNQNRVTTKREYGDFGQKLFSVKLSTDSLNHPHAQTLCTSKGVAYFCALVKHIAAEEARQPVPQQNLPMSLSN